MWGYGIHDYWSRRRTHLLDAGEYGQMSTSTTNPSPRLPTEVCEHIIDLVHGLWQESHDHDRYPILAACCLTCRSWLPRSHFLLWQDVLLRRDYEVPKFIQCLTYNPSNGLLVQRLAFHTFQDGRGTTSAISLIAIQLPHRLQLYASLSLFRNVRSLAIWQIKFSTYDQFFRFVAAFRNLTSLTIRNLLAANTQRPEGRRCSQKFAFPHLQLHVAVSSRILHSVMSWMRPCATSLDISLTPPDDDNWDGIRKVESYVCRCGMSLVQLVLDWNAGPEGIGRFDFSHNTHLLSLRLGIVANEPDRAVGYTRSLSQLLATVSSRHLQDLEVALRSYNFKFIDAVTSHGWDAIDSVLALPMFSQVKRIHIGFFVWSQSEQRPLELSSTTMARFLPRLAKRPIADFSPFELNSKIIDLKVTPPAPAGGSS